MLPRQEPVSTCVVGSHLLSLDTTPAGRCVLSLADFFRFSPSIPQKPCRTHNCWMWCTAWNIDSEATRPPCLNGLRLQCGMESPNRRLLWLTRDYRPFAPENA